MNAKEQYLICFNIRLIWEFELLPSIFRGSITITMWSMSSVDRKALYDEASINPSFPTKDI